MSRAASVARAYVPRARAEREVVTLVEAARSTSRLQAIAVGAIVPNPRNPRAQFSEQAVNELALSLQEDGQLQPVLVRALAEDAPARAEGAQYELIAGERRWRAAVRAGLASIQAAVWEVSDEQSLQLALIENWHRENLRPAEEIAGLEMLAEAAGNVGVRELARWLRVAPSTISERLKVRRDPVVWPALEAGQVSIGHAFRLRRAPAAARPYLLQRTLQEKPPRETLEQWIEEARGEQRRASARVALSVTRLEDEHNGGVRLSNTSQQAELGQQYLDALTEGLDAAASGVALQVYTRLKELLGPDADTPPHTLGAATTAGDANDASEGAAENGRQAQQV